MMYRLSHLRTEFVDEKVYVILSCLSIFIYKIYIQKVYLK